MLQREVIRKFLKTNGLCMREQDGGLAAVLYILLIYNKNISDKFYSENLSRATQMSMSIIITSTGTCVHIDKFAGNCLLANMPYC